MVNVLGNEIVVGEFKHQSLYYVHIQINAFDKGMNPLAMD